MLVQHMREGNSFESFGALAECCMDTLYEWSNVHNEFSEAKAKGAILFLKWWEDLGKAQATGTLRRVYQERAVRGTDGDVILNERGQPVMEKVYKPVRGDSKVWGIFMRSRFRKYGYAQEVRLTGPGGGPIRTKDVSDMTDEELDKELADLEKKGV